MFDVKKNTFMQLPLCLIMCWPSISSLQVNSFFHFAAPHALPRQILICNDARLKQRRNGCCVPHRARCGLFASNVWCCPLSASKPSVNMHYSIWEKKKKKYSQVGRTLEIAQTAIPPPTQLSVKVKHTVLLLIVHVDFSQRLNFLRGIALNGQFRFRIFEFFSWPQLFCTVLISTIFVATKIQYQIW